jgi:GT2 family glycosyltransferase
MDIPPLTTIIILTYNGLSFTKQCISSILQYTKGNFELIFIDNGSTDGSVEFLTSVPNAKVVKNSENRGFSGGCNQGISKARGENIILLNNDTVVSEGWLERLLYWLNSNGDIGIVGPKSNFISEQQRIMPVPYKSIDQMEKFAAEWAENHPKQGYLADQLSGMCMIFKKTLTDTIGGFDERFFPGYFEDTDFCIRVQILGKKLWVANDVFIHHYGSSSFKQSHMRHSDLIHESKRKFLQKWRMNSLKEITKIVELEKPFNKRRHYIPIPLNGEDK